MTTQDLRELLIREKIFPANDRENIGVTLIAGEVARRADRLSQRFSVSYNGTQRYVVKVLPKSWSFSTDDILKTISAYSQLKSIRVPKLVAHCTSDDGTVLVDEYLPSPVSLDVMVQSGAIGSHDAFMLIRNVFSEIHAVGSKPSAQFLQSEKRAYSSSMRSLVREGMWGDLILTYIDRTIDKHADALREVWSSGDLIGRNFLQSNGGWYLIDFEYSHRTAFGFVEAYRNILYTPWARSFSLSDLYPPLGNFPHDVAAMLAIARESMFQAEVLDDEAREMTQKHLRYLFWNVLDPAILPQLDRRVALSEQLAIVKAEEIARLQAELNHWQRTVVPAKDVHIAHLEETLRNHEKNLAIKEQHIRQLTLDVAAKKNQIAESRRESESLRMEVENLQEEIARQKHRMAEVETWGNQMRDLANQRESTIHVQQKSIEELSQREKALATQLARTSAAYSQKVNEFINIKSTLSYSIGRILTLPFEYLFIGVMKLFAPVDRAMGRFLWPAGSRRAMVVNAIVNLKQTIATGTYLLRMHGFSGFLGGVRQTWGAGENLGLHRNFQTPVSMPEPLVRKPVHVARIAEQVRIEVTDAGVSVIIPTLNEADNLIKLLPVLNSQKGFKRIEVIVVDSGSTDDTVQLAYAYGAKVVMISPAEFSHSYSRNSAAEQASEQYLLFTTADALPSSDTWLHEMFTARERMNVTAVSCKELPSADADLFARVQQWYHYKFILEVDANDRVMSKPAGNDPNTLRKHAQLSDVACLIPRDVYQLYKFRYEYGEDLDLGLRLINDGHRLGLLQTTCIIHSHNRPPYYHLKRGYLDKLVLSKILNESLQSLQMKLPDVQSDIVAAYLAISSFSVLDVLAGKEFIPVTELRKRVIPKMQSLCNAPVPDRVTVIDSEYIDPQFKGFLARMIDRDQGHLNTSRSDGVILKGLLQFLEITFDYLQETYTVVDEYVLSDLQALIYKHFANLSGVYIAICYASSTNGEDALLGELHRELGDGKILWKAKEIN